MADPGSGMFINITRKIAVEDEEKGREIRRFSTDTHTHLATRGEPSNMKECTLCSTNLQ